MTRAIDRLLRVFERARKGVGGGPPLRVFEAPDAPVPTDAEPLVEAVFARALERCRFPPRGRAPQVAVRIDLEVDTAGATTTVIRVFDTGPVADGAELTPLRALSGRFDVRREPPSGAWTSVVAVRLGPRFPG